MYHVAEVVQINLSTPDSRTFSQSGIAFKWSLLVIHHVDIRKTSALAVVLKVCGGTVSLTFCVMQTRLYQTALISRSIPTEHNTRIFTPSKA